MGKARLSTASTSASIYSPRHRSSMMSRQSCSSCASLPWEEDEMPTTTTQQSLLTSFPLPVGIRADWPLSRHEKKTLVLMLDRQELMAQKEQVQEQLWKLGSSC